MSPRTELSISFNTEVQWTFLCRFWIEKWAIKWHVELLCHPTAMPRSAILNREKTNGWKRRKQANNANFLSLPAKHTDTFSKSTGKNSSPMSSHADQKALWRPFWKDCTDNPFALNPPGLQAIAAMFYPRGAHSPSFSSVLLTRAERSWFPFTKSLEIKSFQFSILVLVDWCPCNACLLGARRML